MYKTCIYKLISFIQIYIGEVGGECGFYASKLYARSLFGEDTLASLSIEKSSEDGRITGHIRIRAKTQGIALSLGDKISICQRKKINSQALPDMVDR